MYETHTFTDTREHVKINIDAPPYTHTRPHPPTASTVCIHTEQTIWNEANTRLGGKKKVI